MKAIGIECIMLYSEKSKNNNIRKVNLEVLLAVDNIIPIFSLQQIRCNENMGLKKKRLMHDNHRWNHSIRQRWRQGRARGGYSPPLEHVKASNQCKLVQDFYKVNFQLLSTDMDAFW